ncbi:hypothetical protein FDP41_000240 [Naegleria fowleri]|uniref:Uncharacterized protein n=1 Tax=Naegleria fowleri TaxID=5763 RepID=A0A6A5CCY4_NAEFO|nr:uncharacterized protein FDP41_000240 [Naegleria fowleri]KAF0985201.1 hypothetical protein FDP41_000240 [Naegleria fowleri]
MAKVVIFDIGGVLASDGYNEVIYRLFGNDIIPADKYSKIMKSGNDAWKIYKYGAINEQQFWQSVIDPNFSIIMEYLDCLHGFPKENLHDEAIVKSNLMKYLSKYLRDHLTLFRNTLDLIESIFEDISKYPTLEAIGILSNHSKEWSHFIYHDLEGGELAKLFEKNLVKKGTHCEDLIVWSCDVNHAKPEKEIYEILLERIRKHVNSDIHPSQVCFIDDKDRNIEAAQQLGITTIHFDASLPEQFDFAIFKKKLEDFLRQ